MLREAGISILARVPGLHHNGMRTLGNRERRIHIGGAACVVVDQAAIDVDLNGRDLVATEYALASTCNADRVSGWLSELLGHCSDGSKEKGALKAP